MGPRLPLQERGQRLEHCGQQGAAAARGCWKNVPRRRPGGFAERLGVRGVGGKAADE